MKGAKREHLWGAAAREGVEFKAVERTPRRGKAGEGYSTTLGLDV